MRVYNPQISRCGHAPDLAYSFALNIYFFETNLLSLKTILVANIKYHCSVISLRIIFNHYEHSVFSSLSKLQSRVSQKRVGGRRSNTRNSAIAEGMHEALVRRNPATTKHLT